MAGKPLMPAVTSCEGVMEQATSQCGPRGQATKERLRRASIRVFALKGFHDTKVSDIVAEAGVSQPAFYIYFASKEAAYEALVREFRTALREATQQCLLMPDTAPEALYGKVRASFELALNLLGRDRDLTKIGFYQVPASQVTRQQFLGWIVSNMMQEQRSGILRTDIPATHQARLVIGLLDQMGQIPEQDAASDDLAGICARMFCDALAPQFIAGVPQPD